MAAALPVQPRPSFDAAHYREIASKLRLVARECNFPNARRELINTAASFDRRADHIDRREPRKT